MLLKPDKRLNKENNLTKKQLTQKAQRESFRKGQNRKQKELTDTLINTYKAIRPTIIQAQRILKVFENLEQKMEILKLISYDNINKINFFNDEWPPKLKNLITNIKDKSEKFELLNLEEMNLKVEKENYEQIQDSEIESDNLELKEIKKQLEIKRDEIKVLRKSFYRDVRNFIREIQSQKDFTKVTLIEDC
jgi:hypothetical protein